MGDAIAEVAAGKGKPWTLSTLSVLPGIKPNPRGLSRTVILFIVASGLSLILGVLRIPNVAHGSLYMIGAFMAFTISSWREAAPSAFGWRW